jgi:hypothetical protein
MIYCISNRLCLFVAFLIQQSDGVEAKVGEEEETMLRYSMVEVQ